MDLRISDASLESVTEIELLYSSFSMIVNDILSFDKEVRQYQEGGMEGSEILNAVELTAVDIGVSQAAAKRILWVMCRELELTFLEKVQAKYRELDVAELEGKGERNGDMRRYLKGLELIMSGNERWSEYTMRYHGTD